MALTDSSQGKAPRQEHSDSGRISGLALLVASAFFMEFLDGTVIATALPDMAKAFGVTAIDLNIGIRFDGAGRVCRQFGDEACDHAANSLLWFPQATNQ